MCVNVPIDAELGVPRAEHVQRAHRRGHSGRGDERDEEAVVAIHLCASGKTMALAEGGVSEGDGVLNGVAGEWGWGGSLMARGDIPAGSDHGEPQGG
jgi:hypothetical protein